MTKKKFFDIIFKEKKIKSKKGVINGKASRGKKQTLQMIDNFYIDKEELDKILEPFIVIGNINPILKDELNIYLSSAAVPSNEISD